MLSDHSPVLANGSRSTPIVAELFPLRSAIVAELSPSVPQTGRSPTRRKRDQPRRETLRSPQLPRPYGGAQLFQRCHVRRQRLAIAELGCPVAALGVEEVEQGSGPVLIRELRNLARLLRLLQIAIVVELDHLFAVEQSFVGILHVGQNLLMRSLGQELGLRQRVIGARYFTLIAVEDGQRNAEVEGSQARRIDVGVV